ncbi:hypothetical protein P175DRAFT_0502518 [Aspergillus ochraceoroseus IBT 24754]|uniref:Terrelysin n=3 Tax=Aspergillus subgen. Nidulantes TaxID=2720870 RepID=A0A0F8W449_9EURO|nr:uncharacterized protein P175DRAFT_0502518 [Aspergillus ochraceoroseus IBT 24754]KKK12680.1 hypothetical protein ARAM_003362 [Aspergillus rambellii]KKK21391.1 hypothetical protein AOCH_000712 [Aspergillus ochraceoroseus]PTU20381.1 hypothetical protein P175DRAFT_0502518 [Aspergillus ochraceoroseus IBT 24754]
MEPSQWVSIHIRDRLESGSINVKDSLIDLGKFHNPDDQAKSMTENEVDKLVIPANGIGEVCARGRRGSEGWMDLFDGDSKICELYWDNRSSSSANTFEVVDGNKDYKIECSGWSPAAGPLGHVFIDISAADKKKK